MRHLALQVAAGVATSAVIVAAYQLADTREDRPPLQMHFIGNQAFAISDGSTTLLSDYPYQPGYSGYMSYDASRTPLEATRVSLVTHRHLDHFDPSRPLQGRWVVVGPREVAAAAREGRAVSAGETLRVDGLAIQPIATPHADLDHYSYLVTWHGRRLYFTGDTEDASALIAARDLDVAFVSPWLHATARRTGARIDTRLLVIYHHTADQAVSCDGCWVPRQGDSRAIP